MEQKEITQCGSNLIASAQKLGGEELQDFYDNLEAESRHLGGDDSMPLGWVASAIVTDATQRGEAIADP